VVAFASFARYLQQAHRLQQQIVEVESVVLAQFGLVALKMCAMRSLLGSSTQIILLRIDHVVLGPTDATKHGARFTLHQAEYSCLRRKWQRAVRPCCPPSELRCRVAAAAHRASESRYSGLASVHGPAAVHTLAHLAGALLVK